MVVCIGSLFAAPVWAANITPGTGYYNAHAFSTINGSGTVAPTSGRLGGRAALGPTFSIARAANGGWPRARDFMAPYTPGAGANNALTGYPTASLPNQHEFGGSANSDQNDLMRYTFASVVPLNTHVFLQDLDNGEVARLRFYDCSNNLINPSSWDLVQHSTSGLPAATFAAGLVTLAGPGGSFDEPLVAVVIKSAQVCRIDVNLTIVSSGNSAQVYFSMPAARITLQKALGSTRINAADQFSPSIAGTNGNTGTTTGAGNAITSPAVTAPLSGGITTLHEPGSAYTVAEAMAAGSTSLLSAYSGTIACSNSPFPTGATSSTPLPSGSGTSFAITPAQNDNITCTLTNARRQGSITIVKDAVPNDAQDFSFTTTGSGLVNFQLDDDANATLSNTQTFSALAPGNYGVSETPLAAWALTALACTGDTDNGSTINLPGGAVTIDLDDGENITCTFTNSRLPTLSLFKTSNAGTGTFNFNLTNADTDVSVGSVGNQSAAAITTTAPGAPVQFDASPILTGTQNIRIATLNAPVIITEAQTAGFNLQAATSCTAGASGATFTQALVNNGTTAGSMTITPPVGGFAPGSTISCTFVNAPRQANLQVTKTNNATQVTSGTPTTYTIVVSNNGPDAVTGAQVSDTPSSGLTCPAANTVTCAPAGNCPASPLTVGDLVSGITLPTLANGATATLSFSCNVQ